jgi:hypothetical protein
MQLWILVRGSEHLRIRAPACAARRDDAADRAHLAGRHRPDDRRDDGLDLPDAHPGRVSTEAVAGATIAMRIMMFTLMPAWGMSNAAATLVGQNLGAGQPARAEAAVWRIGWMNMALHARGVGGFLLPARRRHRPVHRRRQVIAIGGEWLILAYSYFVYGWWMVSVQAFNGAGDTMTPTWINLVFFWLIQIPLAWALAVPWAGRTRVCSGACSSPRPRSACSRCGCSAAGAGRRNGFDGGYTCSHPSTGGDHR